MLNEGDKAPNFSLPSSNKVINLKELYGKKIILFFYPKDNTPGCTKEACSFSDNIAKLKNKGIYVFGVSKDSLESHEKFKEKQNLRIELLSDKDNNTCERYRVWVKKNKFGKEYMGIERTTFLIDTKGKIKKIWRKVNIDNHINEILKFLDQFTTEN